MVSPFCSVKGLIFSFSSCSTRVGLVSTLAFPISFMDSSHLGGVVLNLRISPSDSIFLTVILLNCLFDCPFRSKNWFDVISGCESKVINSNYIRRVRHCHKQG